MTKKVNWVLDADIRGFFDTLDHGWLVRFVEHRIADRRVVHLIRKWLRAGVLEEGRRTQSEMGTVQGGSISPLRANLYLHYVFDLWVQRWRRREARGEGTPETFNFLGFTHSCGKTRRGGFTVLRQTMRTRWQAKLQEVKAKLRRRLHAPIPEVGAYLRSVVA